MRSTSILLLVFLTGCHGASARPWGVDAVTPEMEALAGMRLAPDLEARHGGVVRLPAAEARMARIGQTLGCYTPAIQAVYRYRILGTDNLNAFSLPGGRIYVTRGLYAQLTTDTLLAAVLAHEIAHLATKDHFKPRSSTDGEALDRELNADARAVRYLFAADMPPGAMAGVIQIIRVTQPRGWSNIRVDSITQYARTESRHVAYAAAQP